MTYPIIDWDNDNTVEQVLSDFKEKPSALEDAELLFASYSYSYENYGGDAIVVFRKDGEFKIVTGGHCSCNGLEGQWSPEPTTVEALKMFKYDKRHRRWPEFVQALS